MADRVGQQFGNYRLVSLLGQGSYAEVYLGQHMRLELQAAIKVLHTHLRDQEAEHFQHEAQTIAKLTHPSIVRILDFDVQDGVPFLVMDYAPDGSLNRCYPKGSPVPLPQILSAVKQVAAALQYAHEHKFIHRDVKPENMLLGRNEEVLLSDFGLAALAHSSGSLSMQEAIGTLAYMAPEQIKGHSRAASDQYALAVVVYEWLCGSRPFKGSMTEVMVQHLTTTPPPLHERASTISLEVEQVVLRALAKDPKERFASVQAFATALLHAAQGTTAPLSTLLPGSAPKAETTSPFLTHPAPVMSERSASEPVSAPTLLPSTGDQEPQRPTPSTLLVGRTLEWTRLTAAWHSASAGRPQLLALSGEAGIGKTRLAETLLAEIGRQGIATAVAHCYAVEEELAYTPVINWLRAEALRPALAALDRVWLAEVARLLPTLLLERPELPPPSPLKEDWQRQRLFEALAHALLGTHGPLLLLLDDLQWCDRETLAWLHYLLHFDPHARLLIVGTQRLEERSTNQPLESLLVSLRREGQVSEIPLGPLDATETAALAEYVAGRTLSPTLAAHLYQETEGNPLFVVETMRMGVAEPQGLEQPPGEPAPLSSRALLSPTIQDVIATRLEQLSLSARELVNVAAVIGRAFTFEVLKQVSGVDEDVLVQALDEMWQRRIIREQGTDGYDFSHDKLREGAYAALSRARRRLLHRRVAEALERFSGSSPDGRLTDLAYHFYEAGAWEQALEYGQRAGEQAQAMYAPRAAIEQFTRALDAAQKGSIPLPTLLYRLRGQAYQTLGDFERARLDYETTLQLARVAGDRQGEWQALMDLGFLWAERDYIQTGAYCQQALALARGMDDPITLAHTLNRLGNWQVNVEQPLEALRSHQEALTLFQQAHDVQGIAQTYDLLGMANTLGGDLLQASAYYQQAVTLFRELDDRQGLASSLTTLMMLGEGGGYETGTMVPATNSFADSIHFGELALETAREIGQRSAEAYALFALAQYMGPHGEYTRVLEAAKASLTIAKQIEHRQWLTSAHWQLGVLYLDLLALPEAQQHLEQALTLAHELGSWNWIRIASGFLAPLHLLQEDLTKAESILTAALEPDAAMQTMGQRVVWTARSELALARSNPGLALDITNRLIDSAANLTDEYVIPRLWELRGEALAALHRSEEAETMLQAAQKAARTQGLQSLQWRICVSLGKLYQGQGRKKEAEQSYSAARTLIEELAATIPDEALRDNFIRQATRMLPHTRSPSPARATKQAFGGLSMREREVAVLIAQGKSNREIADLLVLSERTIESHVSSILLKLDYTSRTQIATWAIEKGLTREKA